MIVHRFINNTPVTQEELKKAMITDPELLAMIDRVKTRVNNLPKANGYAAANNEKKE